MNQHYPNLLSKIDEMADGDQDFKSQLTRAIKSGMEELKQKYEEGMIQSNEMIIQQVRHKVKPTLMLFGFDDLIEFLNEGKVILESEGFGPSFNAHAKQVSGQLEKAIAQLHSLE
ncbi:hypothetical protein ACFOSV_13750 [Algoriphagus namhaensis]|uniref:HPt domain-containing protein n=1 Tax=Algoriphagus namhaensis TaxID=915353 RepID=A0ABV8AWF4_9BACT